MEISGHSQNSSIRQALPFIQRLQPKTWVALDPPGDVACELWQQGVKVIARRHYKYDFGADAVRADMDAGVSPRQAAMAFIQSCKDQSWWPWVWAIMTPPAMAVSTSPPDLLAWAIAFQSYVHAFLAEVSISGIECVVCNVPNQNWGYYVPGVEGRPAPKRYGCQEYAWEPGGSGFLGYRDWFPERVLANVPDASLYILEHGLTALLADPPAEPDGGAPHGADIGFRGGYGVVGISQDRAQELLAAYYAEARKDSYVSAVYYYQLGGNEDWATHEGLGALEDLVVAQNALSPVEEDMDATVIDQYPDQLRFWLEAGGWKNFALWMTATGQLSASNPERRDLVRDRLSSATKEALEFIEQLNLA